MVGCVGSAQYRSNTEDRCYVGHADYMACTQATVATTADHMIQIRNASALKGLDHEMEIDDTDDVSARGVQPSIMSLLS